MSKKILNATFGLAGLIGKPFGKDKKKAAPTPEPSPRVMPIADDEDVRRARRSALMRRRSGRTSTMLTPDRDTLGN